uniref:Coiled-coil domain-containing protein 44 n=1 Tax=Schistosoma japonicum TaxID=6182 RepID=C1LFS4_SCHJA|nr:Coiled-coil domain-containing protein 44 [Schistosoma japonicum]
MNGSKFGLFVRRCFAPTYNNDRLIQVPTGLFVTKTTFCLTEPKRYAGHAHWQNVKHIKEAGDREKSKNSLYYIKAVQKAIRDGGGIRDPKVNLTLAAVLAEAKSKSIPFSTLEKQLNADNEVKPYVIEIKAPGGLFVIVESRAKNTANERQRISALVKRFGCSVVPVGDIADKFFDHIGVVTVSAKSCERLPDLDAATNLGIEIGAKEVKFGSGEEQVYHFYCEVDEIDMLRESLENIHQIPVVNTNVVYTPKILVPILPEVNEKLNEMYEKIKCSHEYVDRIFDNTTIHN